MTAEQRPQVACPSAWAPPSLNGAKRGFPAGVSLLSGRAGLGPVGPSEGTDACSQPGNSSFCSCSICKKKQNRHFIVPASRFKLLKVSAESGCDEPLAPGRWPVEGRVAGSRAGPLPGARLSLSSWVSRVFLKGYVIFPLYILDAYLILP